MDEKTLQEKIDLREHNIHEMRAIHEAAVDEKGEARALTAEEKNKFDKYAADVRDLTAQIDAEKRSQTLAGFSQTAPDAAEPESRESKEMREFAEYLRTGEKRDYDGLTVDNNGPAGALAPTEFLKELQKDLEKETHLVGKVRILRLNKVQEVEIPIEDAEMSDAGWTTEIAAVTKDESLHFTSRKLGADRLAKLVLLSKKAVLTSAFDLPALVRGELGYKMRCALENAIINGDGNGKPLGLFVANANGIPTSRDIASAATTSIDADTIIKAKRAVPSAFRSNASWLFHADTVTQLLTLKDNNGQYLWRSGLKPGDPDILDGSAIIESEFVPHTAAAGAYAGMFGDFSKYSLTMLDGVGIQVLTEKYAESGMMGYLAETFAGGAPINAKAFARIAYKAV